MIVRLVVILFCFWQGVSTLNGQSFSSLTSTDLPALGNVQVEWADFNNDGYQDALVNGIDNDGIKHFEVYQNNQDNTFTLIGLPVSALKNASFLIADFNNDNRIDIFYGGRDATNQVKNHLLINQGTSFSVSNDLLGGFYQAKLLAYDFNLDGQQDIISCGYNATGEIETSVWIQDDLDFTKSAAYNFPDLLGASLTKADLNQDGLLDLMISGETKSGQFITKLLLIDKQGEFTERVFSAISNLLVNDAELVDYTADGLTDMLLMGRNSSFNPVIKLYKSQSGTYSELSTNVPVLNSASLDMKDLDNDGDKDLVIIGLDGSSSYIGRVFINNGAGIFTDANISMDGISNGSIQIVDINKDSKNDFFSTGFSDTNPTDPIISYFYQSTTSNTNSRPATPTGLNSNVNLNTVDLNWTKSTDDLTSSNALVYQLSIGNTTGNYDIISQRSINNGDDLLLNDAHCSSTSATGFLKELSEGEYFWTVQAIDAGGLSSDFATEQSFIVCDKPNLGADLEVCVGDDVSFSAGVVADQVNWYSKTEGLLLADNNDFSFTVSSNDTVIVEVIKPLGCTVYDTVNVEAIQLPESSLPSNTTICEGEVLNLTINESFDNIDWYRKGEGLIQAGGVEYSQEVIVNDTLIAELTNGFGCIGYDTVLVEILPLPTKETITEVVLCQFDTLNYSVDFPYDQISWYTSKLGVIATNSIDLEQSFTESDTLFIDKTNTNNCSVTDTVVVNVNPLPVVDLGQDVSICENSVAEFDIAGSFVAINWSSGKRGSLSTDVNSIDYTVTENDSLFVEVIDNNGCVNTDTLLITKLDLPVFSLGNDTAICINDNILLEAKEGLASVEWTSVKNGLLEDGEWFLDYQATEADTIIAKAFAFNGCTYTDSIFIETIEPPFYNLRDDYSICYGELININIPSLNDSINWFLGDSLLNTHGSSISFEANSSIAVHAEYINERGCIGTDTLNITVNELPVIDLGNDQSICYGEGFELSVEADYSEIKWYSENNGLLALDQSTLTQIGVISDKIYVELTNPKGCFASDTVLIRVNNLPEFSLGQDQQICEGNTVQLEIDNPTDSINWFNDLGEQLLDTTAILNFKVNQTQTWWAEQWNATSCVFSDTIQITNIPLPVFDAGDSILICEEAEVQLNPEGINENWTFEWSPATFLSDASSANPMANPEKDTWFFLEVQNEEGCVYTDSVFVALDQPLILDAGEDQTICLGDFTELGGAPTADGSNFPYQYEWSPMESLDDPNKANPIASPSETTTYQLIAWAGNCKADTAELTVHVQLPPEITLTADTTIGAGDAIQLLASGGSFYQWKPERGLSDATIANPIANPTRTTTYTVEVLDSLGCISEEQMTVFVENQLFIPNLFTPNGDGQNDFFKVYGAGIKEIEFQVFTRGGKLLYRTNSVEEAYSVGWDGNDNGNPVESGVYVWSIKGKYFDGRPLSFNGQQSGLINLMR